MTTEERKKPGPAPIYGERKALLTRVDPALALEFEGYCAAAEGGPISVTEGLQRLIEAFCQKKRAQPKAARHASAGPAPKSVTITALTSLAPQEEESAPGAAPKSVPRPAVSNKSSPWAVLCAKVKATVGAEQFELYLSELAFVSLEGCKLTITAPTPYAVDDVQERFTALFESLASEVCGEPVDLVVQLDPVYLEREREEEARELAEREAAVREVQERKARTAALKSLYLENTPLAAKKAERLIFEDGSLLASLEPFVRKQIEQWISATGAGSAYQAGKEANYKGPKSRR